MALQWEQVAGPFNRLTEGPAWDGQRLLFHLHSGQPHHGLRPGDRRVQHLPARTPTTPTAWPSTPMAASYGCCSGGRSIVRFEPDGGTTTIVDRLDGQRLNTPNDLAIDRRGPHLVQQFPGTRGTSTPASSRRT